MIAAMLAAPLVALGVAAGAGQDGPRDFSDRTPAEAALLIQDALAQGMVVTYRGAANAEGRFLSLTENGLTVIRRGVNSGASDQVAGWYMTAAHIHRFDLAPVEVELTRDGPAITVTLHLSCEDPRFECVMALSSHEMFGGPAEDRGATALSVDFDLSIAEPGYAAELEQLFEIWRSAPEVPL